MGETITGLAQLGAIGLLALLFFLTYKVASPVLTAWVTRKTQTPPEMPKDQYNYNQQMATLVYDNSKNMSELVTISKNNAEILKEVVKSQQQTIDVLRAHAQKSEAFHDTFGKSIMKKIERSM